MKTICMHLGVVAEKLRLPKFFNFHIKFLFGTWVETLMRI